MIFWLMAHPLNEAGPVRRRRWRRSVRAAVREGYWGFRSSCGGPGRRGWHDGAQRTEAMVGETATPGKHLDHNDRLDARERCEHVRRAGLGGALPLPRRGLERAPKPSSGG